MKKNDFLFLIRFLIITLIYFLEFIFLGEDFFILDIVLHPVFFPFMLVMYLMTIVVSFFCGEETGKIIKVVSDSVFMLLFTLQTILLLYLGFEDIGDSGLAVLGIMIYIPIFVCFIFWFVRDIKVLRLQVNLKDFKFKHFYWLFFLRCVIIGVIYFGINYFYPFILLLDKSIFIPILIIYFLVILLASWFQKIVVLKIKIFSDVVFLSLFLLQTICMMCYLFVEFTKLEPKLINLLWYSPLIVLFTVWLVYDVKLLKKNENV